MSDIEKVKKLREATGAGFKDCNLAIKESNGDLDKAIELNPNYFVAYENRASAKRKLGDDEGADEDNKKADKLKKYEEKV